MFTVGVSTHVELMPKAALVRSSSHPVDVVEAIGVGQKCGVAPSQGHHIWSDEASDCQHEGLFLG